jgi:diadenosine tetraphosphate (Ap4A) HIT family hydrolase
MADDGCPFCDIAAGVASEPGDFRALGGVTDVFAFTPLNPFVPGHTLVVPMDHVIDITDADVQVVTDVMEATIEVGQAMVAETDAGGFNVITSAGAAATQTVMHWHVHVIPRQDGDELGGWPWEPPCQHTLG